MTKTEKVISEMLKEKTGIHFLDSGGAYGRHWEINQIRKFEDEPYAVVKFDTYGDGVSLEYTKNIFHYLVDALEYSGKWTKKFNRFASRQCNEDKSWLELMEEFMDSAKEDSDGEVFNSYNDQNCLSQVIQFGRIELDEGALILLQIHGGCDVRGGYTAPRCFFEKDEWSTVRWADGFICCENNPDHRWYSDDAYHWYWEGWVKAEEFRDGQIPLLEHDKCADRAEWVNSNMQMDKLKVSTESWEFGKLYVDDEHNGYCPVCGGKLTV